MARFFISKTSTFLHRHHPHPPKPLFTLSLRHRSSHSANNNGTLMELDLPSTSSSSNAAADYDVTMRMFDDLIHRILVRKATPDWLPFVPGSSFWVPPRPAPSNVVDLVHKLTTEELSAEESLSLATHHAWPSSTFFTDEKNQADGGDTDVELNKPEGMEGMVKVKVLTISDTVAHEDEEG
ncbi:hypothetical protein HN51_065872 [Arachis hypogaea]|uniref:Uncharacterized protein n=1 Tax=Arachis hypogaea TaxID=3818 RepID=A0A444ZHY1_ARAHY|nr:uncharacterized protein LOC107639168 [Arachis ipaensis]XP_025646862.1 uncharacterized protein LOC112741901 [Arachis hypogaea]XP_025646863.1 uncharacterized protein LOC112741901 [Arachis hypogaea]QHO07122.1 uncharacterized protein DS421_14g460830 [Arachis hypogaea]QHO07123.1 uncharacterized protein DS421_14g460830 [Arachis hypogaea]RYR13728.1 hypothetical protein Ahy_B04g070568 [Arachis hypogaea]